MTENTKDETIKRLEELLRQKSYLIENMEKEIKKLKNKTETTKVEKTCETCKHVKYDCFSTVGLCKEKNKWEPMNKSEPTVTEKKVEISCYSCKNSILEMGGYCSMIWLCENSNYGMWQPKETRSAAKNEPTPIGAGKKVIDEVVMDIKARSDMGEKKYGTPLRTFNGRSAMMDLYQELLDSVMYAKQVLMEMEDK